MKNHVQSINKECSLFIRGALETESIMDMILAMKWEKQEKDWLLRQSTGSASCPQTASLDPLPFDHTRAPGNWLYRQNGNCWQQMTPNSPCWLPMHLPLPQPAFPCCFHACEKTQLPPTASTAWEGGPTNSHWLATLASPTYPQASSFQLEFASPFHCTKERQVHLFRLVLCIQTVTPTPNKN